MSEENNSAVAEITIDNHGGRPRHEIEEREKRNDFLVRKVCENHKLPPGTEAPVERQKLLDHYIQLPNNPKYDNIGLQPERPVEPGEILVTLYNHVLRLDTEDDEENGDGKGGTSHPQTRPLSGENKREKSTCKAIPLQWLYDIPNDDSLPKMIKPTELFGYLSQEGPVSDSGGNLQVIEFPTSYYADNFLETMKGVSLEDLIDDSETAIEKVKSDPKSNFLKGITFYPNVPPKQFVSPVRSFYSRDTLIFIAIPYLRQETLSRALFRKKFQQLPDNHPKDGIAKLLTAYQFVDKDETDMPSSSSSLSLLEYKFPSKTGTDGLGKLQKAFEDESEGELTMVHQAWFMVFDNETIAAFRSADDVESDKLPLLPWQRKTEGAYHGLANMLSHILPSADTKTLKKYSQRLCNFEFLVQTRTKGDQTSAGEGLTLKMRIMNLELSSVIDVVTTQIEILQNLKNFNIDENPEQFAFLRETVDVTINTRRSFLSKMDVILQRLRNTQEMLKEILSKEEADKHNEAISEQFNKMTEAAEASKIAAEASQAAAEKAAEAAEAGKTAAEESRIAANESKNAAFASNNAAHESKDASKQTMQMAQESVTLSKGNAKQTEGQSANILIFTYITAIFTPMSFTTSYWGMNVQDIRQTSWSQREYWALTAPLTAFILFIGWFVGFPRPERFRPIIPTCLHGIFYPKPNAEDPTETDPAPTGPTPTDPTPTDPTQTHNTDGSTLFSTSTPSILTMGAQKTLSPSVSRSSASDTGQAVAQAWAENIV